MRFGKQVDPKFTDIFSMIYYLYLNVINTAMVRNFVVMYNKFNVEEICISVITFQKTIIIIMLYYLYYLICMQSSFDGKLN